MFFLTKNKIKKCKDSSVLFFNLIKKLTYLQYLWYEKKSILKMLTIFNGNFNGMR